jgi:hypothetical protein
MKDRCHEITFCNTNLSNLRCAKIFRCHFDIYMDVCEPITPTDKNRKTSRLKILFFIRGIATPSVGPSLGSPLSFVPLWCEDWLGPKTGLGDIPVLNLPVCAF